MSAREAHAGKEPPADAIRVITPVCKKEIAMLARIHADVLIIDSNTGWGALTLHSQENSCPMFNEAIIVSSNPHSMHDNYQLRRGSLYTLLFDTVDRTNYPVGTSLLTNEDLMKIHFVVDDAASMEYSFDYRPSLAIDRLVMSYGGELSSHRGFLHSLGYSVTDTLPLENISGTASEVAELLSQFVSTCTPGNMCNDHISLTRTQALSAVGVLKDTVKGDCPICLCPPIIAVTGKCGHAHCMKCVTSSHTGSRNLGKCSICRALVFTWSAIGNFPSKELALERVTNSPMTTTLSDVFAPVKYPGEEGEADEEIAIRCKRDDAACIAVEYLIRQFKAAHPVIREGDEYTIVVASSSHSLHHGLSKMMEAKFEPDEVYLNARICTEGMRARTIGGYAMRALDAAFTMDGKPPIRVIVVPYGRCNDMIGSSVHMYNRSINAVVCTGDYVYAPMRIDRARAWLHTAALRQIGTPQQPTSSLRIIDISN